MQGQAACDERGRHRKGEGHAEFAGDHRGEHRSDLQRNLHERHDVAKAGGKANQNHHHGHGFNGAVYQLGQVTPLVVAVYKHCHKKCPDHSN